MLKGAIMVEFGMTGQMGLAVFADDVAVAVGEDRGVEMAPLGCQLGIAERDRNLRLAGGGKERRGGGIGHFAFEPLVDLGLIFHVPAREKRGQAEFGKHHEITARPFGLLQQGDHPVDHLLARVGLLNRAHLGAANDNLTHLRFLP